MPLLRLLASSLVAPVASSPSYLRFHAKPDLPLAFQNAPRLRFLALPCVAPLPPCLRILVVPRHASPRLATPARPGRTSSCPAYLACDAVPDSQLNELEETVADAGAVFGVGATFANADLQANTCDQVHHV